MEVLETYIKAIKACKNIDELLWVGDKLEKTDRINRRTKAGKALTNKINVEIRNRSYDFPPFK